MRAGIKFIEKETIRIASGYHRWRTETADRVYYLRYADYVFGGELAAQERNARQTHRLGKLLNDGRLAYARRSPDENGATNSYVEQKVE